MIEVENLSKRYGEKLAVDGPDFVVQPAIVTGFLGRLAAGLWHPGTPVGPQHRPPVPPAYRPIDIPVGADLSDLLNTRPRFDIGTTAWAGSRRCPGRRGGPPWPGRA